MDLVLHLLEHALEDTLYLVPFLLVTYLALEALEHKAGNRAAELVRKAGAAGPFVGALLGAVPQCGFSAAGSALFASRAITLGTLLAVLLSTSDEMLPIFIAEQVDPAVMAGIVGTKIVIGMIMGFAIDGALRLRVRTATARERNKIEALSAAGKAASADDTTPVTAASASAASNALVEEAIAEGHDAATFSHHHCHNAGCSCGPESSSWKDVVVSAVKHTLQVSAIVYLISLALVAVMEIAGEEAIATFLSSNPGIAIFGSALVGLIPSCGASVVITQLYLDGMLGTGAMMAGLLVSAGVGLLVLFGENRRIKQNLLILAGLYATGVVWGALLEAAGIAFM